MKQIILKAISESDGWAIVKEDDNFYFLKPPYDKKIAAKEDDALIAVGKYNYIACDDKFNSYPDVIAHIREIFYAANKGLEEVSDEDLILMLKNDDKETLNEFIDSIEKEFIPKGQLEAAEKFLDDLMNLSNPEMDDEMKKRCEQLKSIVKDKLNSHQAFSMNLQNLFPVSTEKFRIEKLKFYQDQTKENNSSFSRVSA